VEILPGADIKFEAPFSLPEAVFSRKPIVYLLHNAIMLVTSINPIRSYVASANMLALRRRIENPPQINHYEFQKGS
jgi:hypothetical protein